jgi:hypothetical protein
VRPSGFRKRLANGISDRRRDRDAAIRFVHAFDDSPWRLDRTRAPQGALGGRHELVVHPPVLPLTLRHAPPGQRVLLERSQALFLRALPEVHPELQDQRAVVGQVALERCNTGELPVELRRADAAIDAIEHGA